MPIYFDHEKLVVYQESLKLVAWVTDLLEKVPKSIAVWDQMDRSSTSIPLNIAEGNGKYTPSDRCRYFDIARGSTLECAACMDVLVAKRKFQIEVVRIGKELAQSIVKMLVGLIQSNSPNRLHEDEVPYST